MTDKPWENEPDHHLFESHGYVCEVKRHTSFGTLMGYVYIPTDHPIAQAKIPEDVLAVHGGITYWDARDGAFVVGFDCAHAGDIVPNNGIMKFAGDTYKDFDFVINQLENLARQIKEQENAN
jgi:hypothetical protein